MLSNENHIYFHKLSEVQQGYLNAIFQEYKRQVDECKDCKIVFVEDLEVPYEVNAVELSVDEKGKYNRAKKKQEEKKLIKEWEEER